MPTVLVTGASGFVGQALVRRLRADSQLRIRVALRQPLTSLPQGVEGFCGLDILTPMGWEKALEGVDFVVHCAARAHVLQEAAVDPLAAFRAVNTDATLGLAQLAAAKGVRRFIFLSSIGVNGQETIDRPFTADDVPAPVSSYARSKWEAEQGLRYLANESGMPVVILRPPLVYGLGAPGNFARLLGWVRRGLPLPFGAVRNQRSFVYVDNLVDLIVCCLTHPAAVNQVFLAADGEDLSTPELIRLLADGIGGRCPLWPVPPRCLLWMARLVRQERRLMPLLTSLSVDIEKNRQVLGWSPPFSPRAGLVAAVSA